LSKAIDVYCYLYLVSLEDLWCHLRKASAISR
jgi:hypothetical protein